MDKPAYKIIKEDIVSDILSGIYQVGGPIKGQEYYAKKFRVSRTTVRRAFDELAERGLLYMIKGKGTYVKSRTADLPTSYANVYTNEQENYDEFPKASFKMIQIKIIQAPVRVARPLGVAEGASVICIERLKLIDNAAKNYQISYLNLEYVKDVNFMDEDLENGSLYRLLIHKAKLIPHHSDEIIRAVSCPPEIARQLGLESGAPVLSVARVTCLEDGRIMEYCNDYEATDVGGLNRRYYYDEEDHYKRCRWYLDRE